MNSDYILMFIDYLLIPFIATGIDICRKEGPAKREDPLLHREALDEVEPNGRASLNSVDKMRTLLLYASYTTAIAVCVYIIRLVVSRLGINIDTDPGTGIYTIIATAVTLVMPYIKEIIVTYFNVRCEIKGKKETTSVEKK